MQQLTIGKNQAGQRLDKFLKKAFPNAGTGFLYKMLRKKKYYIEWEKSRRKRNSCPRRRDKMLFLGGNVCLAVRHRE